MRAAHIISMGRFGMVSSLQEGSVLFFSLSGLGVEASSSVLRDNHPLQVVHRFSVCFLVSFVWFAEWCA